jgi:hypothetical protein
MIEMESPLTTETEAFHFLMFEVVYFAVILFAAKVGGPGEGFAAFALLSVAALARWLTRRRPDPLPAPIPVRERADGPNRVLVIANEKLLGAQLRDELERCSAEPSEVHVVCPALNPRLKHWVSDEDEARSAARKRLDACLQSLAKEGITASGTIGDPDPLLAVQDALWTFEADSVLVSERAADSANWLERRFVARAGKRFTLPISSIGSYAFVEDAFVEPEVESAIGPDTRHLPSLVEEGLAVATSAVPDPAGHSVGPLE